MLDLFGYATMKEYTDSFDTFFRPEVFRDVLVALNSGQHTFEREVAVQNSKGEKRHIIAKRVILPGCENTWEKSVVTCVDITRQKLTELNLQKALGEVHNLKERLQAENIYLQEEIKGDHNFDEIVSRSDAFNHVLESIGQVAQTDATVLILGESGTGKELIARAIHNTSQRSSRPLVKINCAALPANLIESELFGHEKGAFTGAVSQKLGRFELADGGTIFLDEIGELPIDLQSKLLRVLQEGEFERLGSSKTIKVHVRVIAATNRDLETAVQEKEFRADLFYRLNVFPIYSPPLRDRKEDIPVLVNHFCEKYASKIGKRIRIVSKPVLDALCAYDWPGNVRELENIIERAMIISRGDSLELGDWLHGKPSKGQTAASDSGNGTLTIEEVERNHIIQMLKVSQWKIRGEDGAARKLGLNPTTLEARIKKLGIERPIH
ncbi:MAG: sigma 54-interacting transcriptional regulator [Bacteroidia bacterium]|nr:sigma 54-interacting transcriptional regulator [Bacteroidia bacterium]